MLRTAPRPGPAAIAAEDGLAAVLQRCAARDPAALGGLELRCGERLHAALARICGDDALARRLLPTALADLWEHAGAFDPERETAADWIFGRVRERARELFAGEAPAAAAGPDPEPDQPRPAAPPAGVLDPGSDQTRPAAPPAGSEDDFPLATLGRHGLRRPTVPTIDVPDPRDAWRRAGTFAAALAVGGLMALAGLIGLEILLAVAPPGRSLTARPAPLAAASPPPARAGASLVAYRP